jgi:putative transposase
MPSKFRIKNFEKGGYYHIYNRGIDGRVIFNEQQDFVKFVDLIKRYVVIPVESKDGGIYKLAKPSLRKRSNEMNLGNEVQILAYCLLPDHFHLLVRQVSSDGITKLMRRVNTAYVMYFNNKYTRNGPLFENVYRGIGVVGDNDDLLSKLLDLSIYIHLHPVTRTERRFGPVLTVYATRPEDYEYTSLSQYIGINNNIWIHNVFDKITVNDYKKLLTQSQKQVEQRLGNLIMLEKDIKSVH